MEDPGRVAVQEAALVGGDAMKRVVLVGPCLTQSGYGVHTRQIARWLLNRRDVDLKVVALPWGDTPWLLDKEAHGGLVGQLIQRTVPPQAAKEADVSIQVQLPNEWNPELCGVNIGVTAAVEVDKCNPAWVAACNRMSRVVVPSKHAANSITSAGKITTRIDIVPESFPDEIASSQAQLPLELSAPNNFLIVGQVTGNSSETDRKGIGLALKWLLEAFEGREDVGIVVKTNAGRNTKIDKRLVVGMIGGIVNAFRKGPHPKIHVLHGNMTDSEMASLYSHPRIKALVSMTRGEGFGLPILEAAAAGLPVIATGWSGYMDFMGQGKFISVDYELKPIAPAKVDNNIFMQDTKWAEPSELDFKKKVKKFLDNQAMPRQWAAELRSKLLDSHSHRGIEAAWEASLGDLLT